MIYLDYSATTPVNKEVLETFNKVSMEYPGNPNSIHELGILSNQLMNESIKKIANILNVESKNIICTSSATEANNLALIGTALKYNSRKRHIITTKIEHSSIVEAINYLESIGFDISYVNLDKRGLIDLVDLENKIREDTLLISVGEVNSEVGILQNIREIVKIKDRNNVFLHIDGTQAVGKIKVDLTGIDLYSFSAHKFYGLKGIGALVKSDKINIEAIIHGGKSQSIYRAGTPPLALIVSMAKALRLVYDNIDSDYLYVKSLNRYLKDKLKSLKNIVLNSGELSIPHIINISFLNIKPEVLLHALAQDKIYISTTTACSKNTSLSKVLMNITKNKEIASSSIRISISKYTTKEEIDIFIEKLQENINKLRIK